MSETYDFASNTWGSPGERTRVRALNVNTLDEVPDSSWFTNRIGVRDMPVAEIVRGPNKFERLTADEWTVVAGKGPGGFHPGFRAVHAEDPKQIYQLEVDPPDYPQLATGAEFIGTLIYHALGYHVVDVYPIRVHPDKIHIAPDATVRDASGRRKFTREDLNSILRIAARDSDGRVYFSASRFEEGKDLGQFLYHGTRTDDPNDIHPHEHRRELRANRVFSAWLAHDDSRALNSLNMLVEQNGRAHIRHYMYDFGAILGSATRFPDPAASGHEYYLDKGDKPGCALQSRTGRPVLFARQLPGHAAFRRIRRQQSVRARTLEAELSQCRLYEHASRRCVLGCTARVALFRSDDQGHRGCRRLRRSQGGRVPHPDAHRAT